MISSDYLLEYRKRLEEDVFENRKCMEVARKQRRQIYYEIKAMRSVPIQETDTLPSEMVGKAKKALTKEFYNPSAMRVLQDTMKGVFYYADHSHGNLSTLARITEWFTSGKILSKSEHSISMLVSFRDTKDIAIVKENVRPAAASDILHELFIGFKGTNKLRKLVPNFAYVYGGFSCAESVYDNTGKLIALCGETGESREYIAYEYISNVTLRDAIPEMSASDYYNYFLQILFSTMIAWEEIDWTHYDLHTKNVYLRDLPHAPSFYLQYVVFGKTYRIKARSIATITNYTFSHIILEDKHYGYCLPTYDIRPATSHPFYDIYKLLLFSAKDGIRNKEVTELLSLIFTFFSREPLQEAVQKQFPVYYYLPKEIVENLSIHDFLSFITGPMFQRYAKGLKDTSAKLPFLHCGERCTSAKDIVRIHHLSVSDIRTILEFHDFLVYTDREALTATFKQHYPKAIETFTEKLQGDYQKVLIEMKKDKIIIPDVQTYEPRDIFTKEMLKEFQELTDRYNKVRFMLITLDMNLNVGKDVAYLYDDLRYVETFEKMHRGVRLYKEKLFAFYDELESAKSYIRYLAISPKGNKYLRDHSALRWYLN